MRDIRSIREQIQVVDVNVQDNVLKASERSSAEFKRDVMIETVQRTE